MDLNSFFYDLHPLTFLAVVSSSSWPEIDMAKDTPQGPLSHMVLFEVQCSESLLSLSTLITLCLCASVVCVSLFGWSVEGKFARCVLSAAALGYLGSLSSAEVSEFLLSPG